MVWLPNACNMNGKWAEYGIKDHEVCDGHDVYVGFSLGGGTHVAKVCACWEMRLAGIVFHTDHESVGVYH